MCAFRNLPSYSPETYHQHRFAIDFHNVFACVGQAAPFRLLLLLVVNVHFARQHQHHGHCVLSHTGAGNCFSIGKQYLAFHKQFIIRTSINTDKIILYPAQVLHIRGDVVAVS